MITKKLTSFIIFSFTISFLLSGCQPEQKKEKSHSPSDFIENHSPQTQEKNENFPQNLPDQENLLDIFHETPDKNEENQDISQKIPETEQEIETYFQAELAKARQLEAKKDLEAARRTYQMLTSEFPNRYEPFHHLARISETEQDSDLTYALYELAAQKHPTSPVFYNDFGWFLLSIGEMTEAQKMLHQAIKLAPEEPKYKNNLALCLARLHRYEESFLIFKEAAAGNSTVAYTNLAHIQLQNGDVDAAKKSLQKALATKNDYAPAKEILRLIETHEKINSKTPEN
ncbi:MAG: tetratricopeptide repeat protein [Planctomycetia bacterium]|nr:tetratricopeptide repeat protein [Planctomycetia bacterium]